MKTSSTRPNYRHTLSAQAMLLLCLSTSVLAFSAEATKLCDPNDSRTCGFGGECLQVKDSEQFFYLMLYGFRLDDNVCLCRVRCYNKASNLLCSRQTGQTYYNEWCVLSDECNKQQHITIDCKGSCDGACKPLQFNGVRRCGLGVHNPCSFDEICMVDETDITNYNVWCKKA